MLLAAQLISREIVYQQTRFTVRLAQVKALAALNHTANVCKRAAILRHSVGLIYNYLNEVERAKENVRFAKDKLRMAVPLMR